MKKLISYVLAVVMVLSLVPTAFAAEGGVSKFTDVPADAWYLDELVYAVEHGYISGTSDTTFSPSANLTRAQFVTILGRMLNVDTSRYTSSNFDDVSADSWYSPYVAWAADMGYVNGTSATTFSPDSNLTFEQMGTIMANYIDKSGVVLTPSEMPADYSDSYSISAWAQVSMIKMAYYNLLPVDARGNVRPGDAVVRSEAVVALVRLAKGDGKGGKPISDPEATDTSSSVDEPLSKTALKVQQIHDELWASGQIISSMTEKEKAIEYFRWMCANTWYDSDWLVDPDTGVEYARSESHFAHGPLLYGKGVCDGLAKAYRLLLESEGISSYVELIGDDIQTDHAWVIATLDGMEYEIDPTLGVQFAKNADGSLNEVSFRNIVEKFLYPEEFAKQFEGGFGGPLTEEEIQKKLDEFQAEYNASFGQ